MAGRLKAEALELEVRWRRVESICCQLEQTLPVHQLDPAPFVELEGGVNLGRFSRYWRQAEREVWADWAPQA